jgi:hypothetical protein
VRADQANLRRGGSAQDREAGHGRRTVVDIAVIELVNVQVIQSRANIRHHITLWSIRTHTHPPTWTNRAYFAHLAQATCLWRYGSSRLALFDERANRFTTPRLVRERVKFCKELKMHLVHLCVQSVSRKS